MGDADLRRDVERLIERLVHDAGGSARDRAELRRELESHFAEAGDSPEALRAMLARFGEARTVGAALRRARGISRRALYGAKVAISLGASLLAATAVQLAINIRVAPAGDGVRFGGGLWLGFAFSALVVLFAVLAWELDLEPLCARLERHPVKLAAAIGGTLVLALLVHGLHGAAIPPVFALAASAATVATWALTIAIAARLDRAYLRRLGGPHP